MRDLLRGLLAGVALYLVLIGIGRVSQLRHGPGYLAAGALLLLLCAGIAWASHRGPRRTRRRTALEDFGETGSRDAE